MSRFSAILTLVALAFGLYWYGFSTRTRRVLWIGTPGLIVILGALLLGASLFFGGNIPISDAWDDLYMFEQPFSLETIRLSSGGHVVVISRVFTYLVGKASRFDFNVLLAIQWLGLVLAGIGFYRVLRHYRDGVYPIAWVVAGFALTSLNSAFVLDPRLLQHVLAPVLFLGAVLAFQSKSFSFRNLAAPALCALATLNSAWGLVCWPAFLVPVILEGRKRPSALVIWGALFAGSTYLFKTWFASGYGESKFLTAKALMVGGADFFILIGTFFYPANYLNPFYLAAVPGVLAASALAIYVRLYIIRFSAVAWFATPAAMLAIYGTLGAFLATVGRGEFYPFVSRDMRYNLVAAVFYAAIAAHILKVGSDRVRRAFVSLMLASFICGGLYLKNSAFESRRVAARVEKCLLMTDPFADFECYNEVYPGTGMPHRQEKLRGLVRIMREHKLSVYGKSSK